MKKMIYMLVTTSVFSIYTLCGQDNSSDPFEGQGRGVDPFYDGEPKAKDKIKPPNGAQEFINLSHCYEVFSLPLAQAAGWRREQLSDAELYKRLVEGIDNNNSVSQESFIVLRSRSGETVRSEAASEYIYPTEYEPARIPSSLGVAMHSKTKDSESKSSSNKNAQIDIDTTKLENLPPIDFLAGISTPGTATAFEYRRLGPSIEVSASIAENKTIVSLNLSAEHVSFVRKDSWGQGVSLVEMPEFERQSLENGVTVPVGRPVMLGTFNRYPNSKLDPDAAEKVYYAFITVSVAKH